MTKKMDKIVVFGSYPKSFINFRLKLLVQLKELGHEVIAISPFDKEVKAELTKYGIQFVDVDLIRTGKNPLMDLLILIRLFFIFKRLNPDIVIPVSYTHLRAHET